METLSSRKNPLVSRLRQLARERSGEDVLLEGLHLVQDARSAGLPIELVVAAASRVRDETTRVPDLLRALEADGTRVIAMPDALVDAVSPVRTSSGMVAVARIHTVPLDTLLDRQPALLVALAGVQDPGNVGATVRAAEAGGATGIIVTAATADPLGWKALRGAMGSAFRLPIARESEVERVLDWARRAQLRSLAAMPRGGRPLYEADLTGPTLLLLGGEGGGVPADLAAQTDQTLSVPMCPPVESLNVAVTAALIVYEAHRQRVHQETGDRI